MTDIVVRAGIPGPPGGAGWVAKVSVTPDGFEPWTVPGVPGTPGAFLLTRIICRREVAGDPVSIDADIGFEGFNFSVSEEVGATSRPVLTNGKVLDAGQTLNVYPSIPNGALALYIWGVSLV